MSATVLGCMFDSVKAVARHYFGERQRITESVREYEQQGGVRLLQQRTRSDDRSAAGSKSSGGRPKKRPVRALTTALWQAAIESVAVKQGSNVSAPRFPAHLHNYNHNVMCSRCFDSCRKS